MITTYLNILTVEFYIPKSLGCLSWAVSPRIQCPVSSLLAGSLLNLVAPSRIAGSCDSITHHIIGRTLSPGSHLVIVWSVHGDRPGSGMIVCGIFLPPLRGNSQHWMSSWHYTCSVHAQNRCTTHHTKYANVLHMSGYTRLRRDACPPTWNATHKTV